MQMVSTSLDEESLVWRDGCGNRVVNSRTSFDFQIIFRAKSLILRLRNIELRALFTNLSISFIIKTIQPQ